MELVQNLVVAVRAVRKEAGVEEKAVTPIEIRSTMVVEDLFEANAAIIAKLARVSELRFPDTLNAGLAMQATADFEVAVVYERTIDVPAERARLTKDIEKFEKGIAAAERQLGNAGFVAKAPAHIVEGLKKQRAETGMLLAKALTALDALPKE
jgi:valyl-tRNA synthetase